MGMSLQEKMTGTAYTASLRN